MTEVLFQLCNDPDSDIRLVASDCLNRIARVGKLLIVLIVQFVKTLLQGFVLIFYDIIQTLKDSFQPKFHMEIYREIRKNQSPRYSF